MHRCAFVALAVAGTLGFAAPAMAQGQCSRETLDDVAQRYVKAQHDGSVFALPVGEWVDYRENYAIVSSGVGVISQPADFAWHVALADTGNCRVFVEGVILAPKPYVVGTRLAWTFNGLGQIDSAVTKPGDSGFDAAASRDRASQEDWGPIASDKRDTRDTLMAAARAYLALFAGTGSEAPFAADCSALTNGVSSAACRPEAAGGPLADAEFTVDETIGAVAIRGRLGKLRGAGGPTDSILLRIEGGKIRHVHTLTAKAS